MSTLFKARYIDVMMLMLESIALHLLIELHPHSSYHVQNLLKTVFLLFIQQLLFRISQCFLEERRLLALTLSRVEDQGAHSESRKQMHQKTDPGISFEYKSVDLSVLMVKHTKQVQTLSYLVLAALQIASQGSILQTKVRQLIFLEISHICPYQNLACINGILLG